MLNALVEGSLYHEMDIYPKENLQTKLWEKSGFCRPGLVDNILITRPDLFL